MENLFQLAVDISILLIYIIAFAWVFFIFIKLYLAVKEQQNLVKTIEDTIMIEIKLPREILKSPESMEMIIQSMAQGGGVANDYARKWRGAKPAVFSLEIASTEGNVRFYIRMHKKFKEMIVSQIYAHIPGIEVVDADDYTKLVRYTHLSKDISCTAMNHAITGSQPISKRWKHVLKLRKKHYENPEESENDGDATSHLMPFVPVETKSANELAGMTKADRAKWVVDVQKAVKSNSSNIVDFKSAANLGMIKTYRDYGHDKNPDETFKHDPLVPLLEFMGTMGKGEHFWYQILLQDESVHNQDIKKISLMKDYEVVTGKFPKLFKIVDLDVASLNDGSPKNKVRSATYSDIVKARIKFLRTKYDIHMKGELVQDDFGYDKSRKDSYEATEGGGVDADGKAIPLRSVEKTVEVSLLYNKAVVKEVPLKDTDLYVEQKDEIEMLQKKIGGKLFRAHIRTVYVHDKRVNKSGNGNVLQAMMVMFRNFDGWSSFLSIPPFPNYDWQNKKKRQNDWRVEEIFEEYVEREAFFPHIVPGDSSINSIETFEDLTFWKYPSKTRKMFRFVWMLLFNPFYHPHKPNEYILNPEEVATLYHFPGEVAAVPGIRRVDSVKGSMPENLPIVDPSDLM